MSSAAITPIRPTVNATIETVTPELAEEWLSRNKHNRPLRRHLYNVYAQDMIAGRWQFTGDAIKFAADGSLLDGQHRLYAITVADVSLQMLVVRELDSKAQEVMDVGAKRTAGDALSLGGEKYATILASVISLVITNGGQAHKKVSTAEIIEVAAKHPSIADAVEATVNLNITGLTGSALGYAYWRFSQVDASAADQFVTSLRELQGLPPGSPILALHNRLVALSSTAKSRSHRYRLEVLACMFHAWNAWRRGEDRVMIKAHPSQGGRITLPDLAK